MACRAPTSVATQCTTSPMRSWTLFDATVRDCCSIFWKILKTTSKPTGVCLKGTLFTPLSRTTSTQSLNVQLRRSLDLYINLVAGFNLPNVSTRQKDLDIVVIRCVAETPPRSWRFQSLPPQ